MALVDLTHKYLKMTQTQFTLSSGEMNVQRGDALTMLAQSVVTVSVTVPKQSSNAGINVSVYDVNQSAVILSALTNAGGVASSAGARTRWASSGTTWAS